MPSTWGAFSTSAPVIITGAVREAEDQAGRPAQFVPTSTLPHTSLPQFVCVLRSNPAGGGWGQELRPRMVEGSAHPSRSPFSY